MISAKGSMEDYEKIVNQNISAEEKMVQIMRVVIKLLLGIRTNQRGGVPQSGQINKRPEVTPEQQ